MKELDRFLVQGDSCIAENGRLALKIGNISYKIMAIKREPLTAEGNNSGQEEWVIFGE